MTQTPLWRWRGAAAGRILWVTEHELMLGTDDGGLVAYAPTGARRHVASPAIGPLRTMANRSRLASRLLRSAPRSLAPAGPECWLWTAGGRLWRSGPDGRARQVHAFPVGHGPLFLAVEPSGVLWWGDYVATRGPAAPVSLWSSDDSGRTWGRRHVFPAGTVRHVHGVFWDDFARQLWVTTGDDGEQIGLWLLEDGTPRRVLGGEGRFRIVQPVFTRDHIIFGSDVPGTANGLFVFERATGRVEQVADVRGPVFYGTRVGSYLAFSSVVEPLHHGRQAALYVARADTLAWQEVLTLPKDIWPPRLFQYGQLCLPHNTSEQPLLWLSPVATAHDGGLLCLDLSGGARPAADQWHALTPSHSALQPS